MYICENYQLQFLIISFNSQQDGDDEADISRPKKPKIDCPTTVKQFTTLKNKKEAAKPRRSAAATATAAASTSR